MSNMDPSVIQQFIAEQEAVADPERAALEALAKQKCLKYLIYHKKRYDVNREQVLAKRNDAYQPT